MKRIIYLFAVLLIMATGNAQTLSERHKGLAACACLMAHGDMNRLEPITMLRTISPDIRPSRPTTIFLP